MSALTVTLIALALILLRVPVAYAFILPSLAYIAMSDAVTFSAAVEKMTSSVNSFPLLAVPLFILLGSVANAANLSERLFTAASAMVGRFRGGLGYVNVLAALGFSWMSGAAASDVAVLGRILPPQMTKRGYSNEFTAGITAAGSLVTPMMPPSIPAIIFGVASGVSIGSMLLAGVVPAILLVAILAASVWWYARSRPELVDNSPVPGGRRHAVITALPMMLTPVIILGGILAGIFTPTEAAAIGVAFLVLIGAFGYRTLTWKGMVAALQETFITSAGILFLVAGSALFGWVLTMERVPQTLATLIMSFTDNPTVFLLLMMVAVLLVGMFMEPTSAILVTTPVLFPIATELGVPPTQFGIVLVFTLLIGLLTPPVGLVLFVLESVSDFTISEIIRGVLPYVVIYILFAVLLILVPGISLWLPGVMG